AFTLGRFFGCFGTFQDVHKERNGLRIARLAQGGDCLTFNLEDQRIGYGAAAEESFRGYARGAFIFGEVAGIEVGFLQSADSAGIVETTERFDGGQAAQRLTLSSSSGCQDVDDRVLVMVVAVVLFRFFQSAESAGSAIAVI